MLDTVQELRTAGAEAMQFNGKVRVVAQTSFEDAAGGIVRRRPAARAAVRHRRDRRARHAGRRADVPRRARPTSSRTTAPAWTSRSSTRSTSSVRPPEPASVTPSPTRGSSLPTRCAARRHRARPPTGEPVYPDDLKYTAEHEWLRTPGEAEGSVRVGITALRPGRARRHRLRLAARGGRHASRPAAPAASWSPPSRSATSTRRSPARSSPATTPSTPPPSWSTTTRTAAAGSSRSCRPTRPARRPARRRGVRSLARGLSGLRIRLARLPRD